MSSTFIIDTPPTAALSVEQGSTGSLTFTVRNGGSSFRNLGLRVAVLNEIGAEDRDAPSRSWFQVENPPDSFVAAGAEVSVAVQASPPADATASQLRFALVAFDSDLADEDFTVGPPASLTVTEKVPVEEPPTGIPFWVWIAVGLGALGVIIAIIAVVVSSQNGDDDDTTVAADDDDTTLETPTLAVEPVRHLPILFKAYEGRDPVSGGLANVEFKLESTIAATETVKTNADGDGSVTLCIVEDPSVQTERCLKVGEKFSMYAKKTGYKDSPVTTLAVEDLVSAPKTYVQMVENASPEKPTRPVAVDSTKTVNIADLLDKYRSGLEIDGGAIEKLDVSRFGNELRVVVDTSPKVYLVAFGDNKLDAIKIVREYTGLGLADSKALVESSSTAPALIDVPAKQREELVKRFKAAGIKAMLK